MVAWFERSDAPIRSASLTVRPIDRIDLFLFFFLVDKHGTTHDFFLFAWQASDV